MCQGRWDGVCPAHSRVHSKCLYMETILETGKQCYLLIRPWARYQNYLNIKNRNKSWSKMFPLTFCYISQDNALIQVYNMLILKGRDLLEIQSSKDLQLWQCKLFGCHLFPASFLAKFTLSVPCSFHSSSRELDFLPVPPSQSLKKQLLDPCCASICTRMAPKIFPTWDWPFDYQPPMRCPSSRLQSTGNGTHRCKAR